MKVKDLVTKQTAKTDETFWISSCFFEITFLINYLIICSMRKKNLFEKKNFELIIKFKKLYYEIWDKSKQKTR